MLDAKGSEEANRATDPLEFSSNETIAVSKYVKASVRTVTFNVNVACFEAFIMAADHTSLSEAARACGVKDDTFRKRINALEAWANVKLMQRRPDLILTPDGMRLLPYARQVCATLIEYDKIPSIERALNRRRGTMRKSPNGSLRRRKRGPEVIIYID